ncbi:MAG: hypothetical protein C0490_05645 [Marivirga sp.]|nr:hypothetical protein [Marivirga sp.]
MITEIPKDRLIEMFINKSLFSFLLKKKIIKKGDTISYGKILGVTADDLRAYFNVHGYPGLDIQRNQVKKSPSGGEGDSEWTFENGVYKVWYTERNDPICVFSTDSREAFQEYWVKENFHEWEYRLNESWVL